MASFTGVGDNVTLSVPARGETVLISISGTYEMDMEFQRRQGSPGSGAWQTIYTYDLHDDTIADEYVTEQENEEFRLIVTADTDGTATATLTDNSDVDVHVLKDQVGNTLETVKQSGHTFHGTVDVEGAGEFESTLVGRQRELVDLTSATAVLTQAEHAGRIMLLNRAGGIDIDLPNATGSGSVYEFVVVTATTDGYEISAFDVGDDLIQGVICGVDDAAEFTWGSEIGADNTITLGGTGNATGGQVGDYVKLIDVAAGVYHAQGFIHHGTGSEATPFSTDS